MYVCVYVCACVCVSVCVQTILGKRFSDLQAKEISVENLALKIKFKDNGKIQLFNFFPVICTCPKNCSSTSNIEKNQR